MAWCIGWLPAACAVVRSRGSGINPFPCSPPQRQAVPPPRACRPDPHGTSHGATRAWLRVRWSGVHLTRFRCYLTAGLARACSCTS
eukprot:5705441-Pyramimonas_sp.AAC.1